MPFPITCDISLDLLTYFGNSDDTSKKNLILLFFEKRSKGESINSQKMLTKFVMSLLYYANNNLEIDYWRSMFNKEDNQKEILLFLSIRKLLIATKFNGTYHTLPDTIENLTLEEDDWINLCKKIFLHKTEMQKFIDKLSKEIQKDILDNKTKRIDFQLS